MYGGHIEGVGPRYCPSIEDKINSGKFEVGFILHPATIDQVKEVADAGMNMPPKSTWVEPKLRSGLTIYQLHA